MRTHASELRALDETVEESGAHLGRVRCMKRGPHRSAGDNAGFDSTIHVIDAPRDVCRERVRERNRRQGATFSMFVPSDAFELASDLREPPWGASASVATFDSSVLATRGA